VLLTNTTTYAIVLSHQEIGTIMAYDYINCTAEELANHVEQSTPQLISTTLIYYQKRGVNEMVEKIKEARKIVKKRKLLKQLEGMN